MADYVPFYFAPRSPMLFSSHKGNVASYQDGCEPIVHLATTFDRLHAAGLACVVSDRNARLGYARFSAALDGLDNLVDRDLMRARIWKNTPEEPDRMERRMAECLVRGPVSWQLLDEVVVQSERVADRVSAVLRDAGQVMPVTVRREWYF